MLLIYLLCMCVCLCRSRAKNMVLMGYLGGKELLSNSQKSLSQRLTLEVHTYVVIVCLSVCMYVCLHVLLTSSLSIELFVRLSVCPHVLCMS